MNKSGLLECLQKINKNIPDDSNVDLIKSGIIDSFDIANIVAEIHNKFDIVLQPEDILPENFSTVDALLSLLKSRYMKGKI